MLADHRYCYPLTITDFASRYLLCCEGLQSTRERFAFSVFERTFKRLWPAAHHPHRQRRPVRQLQHLLWPEQNCPVWWLRLGIAIERIKPAHPEQNGRHERMHLTLKKEATKPAGKNFLPAASSLRRLHSRLQPRATASGSEHALPGRSFFKPSVRAYAGLTRARISLPRSHRRRHAMWAPVLRRPQDHLSQVFAGQAVGVKEVGDHIWLISFMHYDLGFFDDQCNRVDVPQPLQCLRCQRCAHGINRQRCDRKGPV